MPRLAGKLALVTGGNSGIGLATAKAFVAEGARVAITGRNQQTLEAAKRELGEGTLALKCDAANLSELDELYAAIKQRLGALDILFANAGIGGSSPLADTTEETFDTMFDINVKGVFFTVQKALPLLRNGASIILNASIAPHVGRPGASVYAGTKAAVRAFARNFSAELVARNIRVNAVSPGPIATPIWTRGARDPGTADTVQAQVKRAIPLGRFGTADEVANVVVFLASDESSYLLGTEIIIDGGITELPAGAPTRRD
jgi:NAD(P)-dependent dehydrogenase (short-subunit alcohol dehydrogenase family)